MTVKTYTSCAVAVFVRGLSLVLLFNVTVKPGSSLQVSTVLDDVTLSLEPSAAYSSYFITSVLPNTLLLFNQSNPTNESKHFEVYSSFSVSELTSNNVLFKTEETIRTFLNTTLREQAIPTSSSILQGSFISTPIEVMTISSSLADMLNTDMFLSVRVPEITYKPTSPTREKTNFESISKLAVTTHSLIAVYDLKALFLDNVTQFGTYDSVTSLVPSKVFNPPVTTTVTSNYKSSLSTLSSETQTHGLDISKTTTVVSPSRLFTKQIQSIPNSGIYQNSESWIFHSLPIPFQGGDVGFIEQARAIALFRNINTSVLTSMDGLIPEFKTKTEHLYSESFPTDNFIQSPTYQSSLFKVRSLVEEFALEPSISYYVGDVEEKAFINDSLSHPVSGYVSKNHKQGNFTPAFTEKEEDIINHEQKNNSSIEAIITILELLESKSHKNASDKTTREPQFSRINNRRPTDFPIIDVAFQTSGNSEIEPSPTLTLTSLSTSKKLSGNLGPVSPDFQTLHNGTSGFISNQVIGSLDTTLQELEENDTALDIQLNDAYSESLYEFLLSSFNPFSKSSSETVFKNKIIKYDITGSFSNTNFPNTQTFESNTYLLTPSSEAEAVLHMTPVVSSVLEDLEISSFIELAQGSFETEDLFTSQSPYLSQFLTMSSIYLKPSISDNGSDRTSSRFSPNFVGVISSAVLYGSFMTDTNATESYLLSSLLNVSSSASYHSYTVSSISDLDSPLNSVSESNEQLKTIDLFLSKGLKQTVSISIANYTSSIKKLPPTDVAADSQSTRYLSALKTEPNLNTATITSANGSFNPIITSSSIISNRNSSKVSLGTLKINLGVVPPIPARVKSDTYLEPSLSDPIKHEIDKLTKRTDQAVEIQTSDVKSSNSKFLSDNVNPIPTGPVTGWVPIIYPAHFKPRPSLKNRMETVKEPSIITEPTQFDLTVTHSFGRSSLSTLSTERKELHSNGEIKNFLKNIRPISENNGRIESSGIKDGQKKHLSSFVSRLEQTDQTFHTEVAYEMPSRQSKSSSLHTRSREPSVLNVSTMSSERIQPTPVALPEEEFTTIFGSGILLDNIIPAGPRFPTGRPYVVPVDIEDVRPFLGLSPPNNDPVGHATRVNNHNKFLSAGSVPGATVGDARPHSPSLVRTLPKTLIRRPPFKRRPPIIRIDTCIIGDPSTCDVNLNERCQTELGISACHCKPGFSRRVLRGPCMPVVSLTLAMKADSLDDKKLQFSHRYQNPNSDEYQLLEYESEEALSSLFPYTSLADDFLNAKINMFYSVGGVFLINATVNLKETVVTKFSSLKEQLQNELNKVINQMKQNIGDSRLQVQGPSAPIPLVEDLNECGDPHLNDCSDNGICVNEFGTFRCRCKPGFLDKLDREKWTAGRVCHACSSEFCNNHGECIIENGATECKCTDNYMGTHCDIDREVLTVALAASLTATIIIILTLVCLCVWNRRWQKVEQKVEAAPSAGSGQTFSYVHKNSTPGSSYRLTMEDRFMWQQISDAVGNIYASQTSGPYHSVNHSSGEARVPGVRSTNFYRKSNIMRGYYS
ncbi:uncharacterized protein LOC143231851 isoform X2 [Tachypleus tridentatus]|uniref:uncharacterized protein LOC143231851 isoform X2 n=1 Tax=Tachypleus tridentatus TaxID=6853 RepID=UPI003FD361C6